MASRFIESLLLGLPVPSVFLANIETSGKRLIIDGYQRIRTLHDFIEDGIWHGDESTFRLMDSQIINERWRGKPYKDLSKADKRRLKNYTIHAIIFEQKFPKNDSGLFQVFERINTGGTPLNNQEIRNCVYQGKINTLLFKLNQNPDWRTCFSNKNEDSRMLDIELILRFLTLNNKNIYNKEAGQISLKQELNNYMQDNVDADETWLTNIKSNFDDTISRVFNIFGEEVFFNLQNDLRNVRRRLHPAVYDSIMIATSIAIQRKITFDQGDYKQRRLKLLKSPDYRKSITQGTMLHVNIHNRIDLALKFLYDLDINE